MARRQEAWAFSVLLALIAGVYMMVKTGSITWFVTTAAVAAAAIIGYAIWSPDGS